FDKAERPFLFWKTNDQPAKIPDNLDQVRDVVDKAWKTEKARDDGLKRAKEIAEAFQKTPEGASMLSEEARNLGKEPIRLDGVATLVLDKSGGLPKYIPYALPKGSFDFPREDMAASLTKLTNLKKPIETGKKEIDEINAELFKVGEANNKVVQILSN